MKKNGMGLGRSSMVIACCLFMVAGGGSLCGAAGENPVIEFGRVNLDTHEGKRPNALYGIANNDAKAVCLNVDFAFDTEKLDRIDTSCGCSKVIHVEKEEGHVTVMVNVDLPFNDGKQLFYLNFFDKKGSIIATQEVCLFKGKARCLLGRLQAKLGEFEAASGVEILVRLLGAKNLEKIEVKIENPRMKNIINISKIDHARGVFTMNIQLEDPTVGLIWLDIACDGETFRSPFLIVK